MECQLSSPLHPLEAERLTCNYVKTSHPFLPIPSSCFGGYPPSWNDASASSEAGCFFSSSIYIQTRALRFLLLLSGYCSGWAAAFALMPCLPELETKCNRGEDHQHKSKERLNCPMLFLTNSPFQTLHYACAWLLRQNRGKLASCQDQSNCCGFVFTALTWFCSLLNVFPSQILPPLWQIRKKKASSSGKAGNTCEKLLAVSEEFSCLAIPLKPFTWGFTVCFIKMFNSLPHALAVGNLWCISALHSILDPEDAAVLVLPVPGLNKWPQCTQLFPKTGQRCPFHKLLQIVLWLLRADLTIPEQKLGFELRLLLIKSCTFIHRLEKLHWVKTKTCLPQYLSSIVANSRCPGGNIRLVECIVVCLSPCLTQILSHLILSPCKLSAPTVSHGRMPCYTGHEVVLNLTSANLIWIPSSCIGRDREQSILIYFLKATWDFIDLHWIVP